MLGLVIKVCQHFQDAKNVIHGYSAHVRSFLEYGAVIWYPNQQVHIDQTKSIKKKNIFRLFKKFGWLYYIQFEP